jgi:hypothetical protein
MPDSPPVCGSVPPLPGVLAPPAGVLLEPPVFVGVVVVALPELTGVVAVSVGRVGVTLPAPVGVCVAVSVAVGEQDSAGPVGPDELDAHEVGVLVCDGLVGVDVGEQDSAGLVGPDELEAHGGFGCLVYGGLLCHPVPLSLAVAVWLPCP